MILPWVAAAIALVIAAAAWMLARRNAQRLAQLSQMYWELKYQHGELKAQVQQLAGGEAQPTAPPAARPPERQAPPADGFIPLASLRR